MSKQILLNMSLGTLKSLFAHHNDVKDQVKIIEDSHDNLARTHNGDEVNGRKPGAKWTRKDYARQSQNFGDFNNIKKARTTLKKSQRLRNSQRRSLESSNDKEYMDYISSPEFDSSMMKNYDTAKGTGVLRKGMDYPEIRRRLMKAGFGSMRTITQTEEVPRSESKPITMKIRGKKLTFPDDKTMAEAKQMMRSVIDKEKRDVSVSNPAGDPSIGESSHLQRVNAEVGADGTISNMDASSNFKDTAAAPQETQNPAPPKAIESNTVSGGGLRENGGSTAREEELTANPAIVEADKATMMPDSNALRGAEALKTDMTAFSKARQAGKISGVPENPALNAVNQDVPITTYQDDIVADRAPNETEPSSTAQANMEADLEDNIEGNIRGNRRRSVGANKEGMEDDSNRRRRDYQEQGTGVRDSVQQKFNDSAENRREGGATFIDNPGNVLGSDMGRGGKGKSKEPRLGVIISADEFIKKYLAGMSNMGQGGGGGCECHGEAKNRHTSEHLEASNCPILVKSGGMRHVKRLGTGQVIKSQNATSGAGFVQDPKLRRDVRNGLSFTTNSRVIHRYPTEFKIK